MHDPVIIVVTGGPCAGKTTVMTELKAAFGDQVLVMPEVASLLLDGGFPKPNQVNSEESWLNCFQNSIFPVQANMEEQYRSMATKTVARVLLLDRGLLDGAAYWGRGLEAYLELFGITQDHINQRYHQVVHLESVAVSDPSLYAKLKATNPARYEDADEAAQRDLALREVWQGHPNWTLVPSAGGISQVIHLVHGIVAGYLRKEVERKFRLREAPHALTYEWTDIEQGYLPVYSGELRIRRMGNQYYLTIKGEGDLSRSECERQIDDWAFEQLYPETANARVKKRRYFIPSDGHTLELDVYQDHLHGLVTVECEFPNEAASTAFTLPSWLGEAKEVTVDPRFKNRNLAYGPLPPW